MYIYLILLYVNSRFQHFFALHLAMTACHGLAMELAPLAGLAAHRVGGLRLCTRRAPPRLDRERRQTLSSPTTRRLGGFDVIVDMLGRVCDTPQALPGLEAVLHGETRRATGSTHSGGNGGAQPARCRAPEAAPRAPAETAFAPSVAEAGESLDANALQPQATDGSGGFVHSRLQLALLGWEFMENEIMKFQHRLRKGS